MTLHSAAGRTPMGPTLEITDQSRHTGDGEPYVSLLLGHPADPRHVQVVLTPAPDDPVAFLRRALTEEPLALVSAPAPVAVRESGQWAFSAVGVVAGVQVVVVRYHDMTAPPPTWTYEDLAADVQAAFLG